MLFQDQLKLPNLNKVLQSMGGEDNEELAQLRSYKDLVRLRIKSLTGRAKEIGDAYQHYANANSSNSLGARQELKKVLFEGKKNIAEVLADGLSHFFYGLLPEEMAQKHCDVVLRLQDYTYNYGVSRRSFRAEAISAYSREVMRVIASIYFNWYDFDLVSYLALSDEEIKKNKIDCPDSFIVSQLLALEIDNNNSRVIEMAKNTITSDNNTKIIDYTFVRGMAKSHNKEIHLLMRDLLLAAKLQEGLRQVILETADDGTIDYFIILLEAILEHNLLRFSSCLRAVNTWMGLGYDWEDKRTVEKLVTLGFTYIKDADKRRAACESKDAIEMFCAMWAESVYSADALYIYIDKYMTGEKYQKLIALYFLNQTDYDRTKLACDHLEEEDLDILAWVLRNYNIYGWGRDKEAFFDTCRTYQVLADKESRQWQFDRLVSIMQRIPKDGYVVSGKPFDWCYAAITWDNIYVMLLAITGFDLNANKISKLIDLIDYASADSRIKLIRYFLDVGQPGKDRDYLFSALSDKSMPVRIAAAKAIKDIALDEDELERIGALLALKTGEIRQVALDIIKNQNAEIIRRFAAQLVQDKSENKRLGALDILAHLLDKEEIDKSQVAAYLALMPKMTERERILVEELQRVDAQQYTQANGFGLYDVKYQPDFPPLEIIPAYTLETFKAEPAEKCIETVRSLIEVIRQHKDYTYTIRWWDGSEEEVILGNQNELVVPVESGLTYNEDAEFSKKVLADVWLAWAVETKVSLLTINKIKFAERVSSFSNTYEVDDYEPWANDLIKEHFDIEGISRLCQFFRERGEFQALAKSILIDLSTTYGDDEISAFNCGILTDLINNTQEDDWTKVIRDEPVSRYSSHTENTLTTAKEVRFFIDQLGQVVSKGPGFERRLNLCYELGKLSGCQHIGLDEVDIARAVTWGILPVNELYRTFFELRGSRQMLTYTGKLLGRTKDDVEKYPVLKEVSEAVAQRVIDIEVKRGDTKTEVSRMADNITQHEGIQNFVDVLLALGSETLARGYDYNDDDTKKYVLSSLLKTSVPAPGDDAKALKKLVDGRISDKRLLEAAMYAPAWISIVEEYLGWKGLKSGAWYFHAHTRSGFSAQFETEVAHFSPISSEDFQEGAFDINWFKSAYKTLGKERFDTLYDCAKYISSGSEHRRAQMFADAVLGKMNLAEVQTKISDKRNKDLMLSYSLIPLGKAKLKDALKRYEFIQNFLKESKQFGAQRRASEAKICEIALGNLARNLGIDDVTRFSWKMEILKLDQIADCFKPHEIEEFTTYIDEGTMNVVVLKEGKALKSVPAKLKKNPYIEKLKLVKGELVAQQKRAKASFEKAMESQDEFPYEEILDLLKHPVIRPIVTKLVFAAGETIGFLCDEGLREIDGTVVPLDKKTNLLVAHSYNLYKSGKWSGFQRYAFEHQLVQPFKQIFRELYLINDDERKERTISRRYAGNQIQPQKTVALLKGRNWTVDYDNGLQKVYYKENVIATMYALADWYSPADVEAPTLETVEFRNRNSYKPMAFEDLPPVLFSEVMRDVDLAVSVAHVGGVDPMASHSTIEMRGMIVREIAGLLKLSNVTVDGNHCKIIGTKGEYSVHLGSGIAHMSGKGALNILPIHSQHRGKIFLPFLDEDPKTAEILSKILLLAEDEKVKDATILSQII